MLVCPFLVYDLETKWIPSVFHVERLVTALFFRFLLSSFVNRRLGLLPHLPDKDTDNKSVLIKHKGSLNEFLPALGEENLAMRPVDFGVDHSLYSVIYPSDKNDDISRQLPDVAPLRATENTI